MRKLFYFFDMEYERITHNPDMPFRIILESIGFVGPHWHSDIEVLMMLRGSVTVTNNRGKFRLLTGDIMIINSDEMHSLVELSDNLMIVCQFDSSLLSSLSASHREYLLPCENIVPDIVISAMRRDIAGIWTEKQKMRSGYKSFCMSRLYNLLGVIIRNIPSQNPLKEQSHDLLHVSSYG